MAKIKCAKFLTGLKPSQIPTKDRSFMYLCCLQKQDN